MLEEPLVEDVVVMRIIDVQVESKKSTYREKAIEKYELGNYLNNSSQMQFAAENMFVRYPVIQLFHHLATVHRGLY